MILKAAAMKNFLLLLLFLMLSACSSSEDSQQLDADNFYKSEIKTVPATNLNPYSFSSSLTVDAISYSSTSKGICYSEAPEPKITDGIIDYNNAGESHEGYADLTIKGLKPDTKYYVRGYIKNYRNTRDGSQEVAVAYGNTIEVRTLSIENLSIGKDFAGGRIVYLLKSGDSGYDGHVPHGLIAIGGIPSTSVYEYGCYRTLIYANSDNFLGAGSQNTTSSIVHCSPRGYASGKCYTTEFNQYTDYYLPSLYELSIIRENFRASYPPGIYWSSTEIDAWSARSVNFSATSGSLNDDKDKTYKIIPVRKF